MTHQLVVTIALDTIRDGDCVSTTLGAWSTLSEPSETPLELLRAIQRYLGGLYRPVTPAEARAAFERRRRDEDPWHQLELF